MCLRGGCHSLEARCDCLSWSLLSAVSLCVVSLSPLLSFSVSARDRLMCLSGSVGAFALDAVDKFHAVVRIFLGEASKRDARPSCGSLCVIVRWLSIVKHGIYSRIDGAVVMVSLLAARRIVARDGDHSPTMLACLFRR